MAKERGEQRRLAKSLGISFQHMNDIVNRRRRPSPDITVQLEELTGIDRRAWLWPEDFENPFMKKAARSSNSSLAQPQKAPGNRQRKDISYPHPSTYEDAIEPATPSGKHRLSRKL